MDRYWFFTWQTYCTWLPGEDGFVGDYRHPLHGRTIDHFPGEPTTAPIPALTRFAESAMSGTPVELIHTQAVHLLGQFHETAGVRGWVLDAVAVLSNHVHLVFGVPEDPDPSEMLKSWKSYASRVLNRTGAKPPAPRWFADGGSKRPVKGESNRASAIRYVRDQVAPLVVWLSGEAELLIRHYPESRSD
jgi:REP element-mobilizing transposase RayT